MASCAAPAFSRYSTAGRGVGDRRGSGTTPPRSGRLSIPSLNAAEFEYQYADGAGSRESCSAVFKAAVCGACSRASLSSVISFFSASTWRRRRSISSSELSRVRGDIGATTADSSSSRSRPSAVDQANASAPPAEFFEERAAHRSGIWSRALDGQLCCDGRRGRAELPLNQKRANGVGTLSRLSRSIAFLLSRVRSRLGETQCKTLVGIAIAPLRFSPVT